jgi:hypothetical protein
MIVWPHVTELKALVRALAVETVIVVPGEGEPLMSV